MAKLKGSGYSEKFRQEIILSAKKAYSKMLEDNAKGIKPLYRNRAEIEYDKSIRKSKGHGGIKEKLNIKLSFLSQLHQEAN